MNRIVDEITRVLQDASRILIVTHVYPDADALGSQLALGDILTAFGKKVCLFSEEKISYMYDFLPGSEKLATDLPNISEFDCVVALDCGDSKRLGREMEVFLSVHPFIMIDHHSGNNLFGDINWVDAKRASTGEMVYDLAVALDARISYEAAYCLYAAILSDTGSFKYSSTTADTFRVAGELIRMGVKPSEVAGNLFDNFTVNRLNLMKEVLGTLSLHADGRIAAIFVTQAMFAATGACPADTETFINYPRSLSSVKVALFIKEAKPGEISVSLRSKGVYDIAVVAAGFGGGGHRNAAGFRVRDSDVQAVRERVLAALAAVVAE
jgi:phosphoesterase RecJ-like protein